MKTIYTNPPKLRLISFSLATSLILAGCLGGETTATNPDATTTSSTSGSSQPSANPMDDSNTQIVNAGTDQTQSPSGNGSAVLYWQAPTTNTDGSTLVNLHGYKVYAGSTSADLRYVGSAGATATSYTVNNLGTGAHYFAVSAYNQLGAESAFSNVATKTITN